MDELNELLKNDYHYIKSFNSKNDKVDEGKNDKVDESKKTNIETINFNDQLIDRLTKDINATLFFIKNQTVKYTDNVIIAMLIKYKYIKDYKCCCCRITTLHNRKPINLLVNFINGNQSYYEPKNIELICPNCYFQKYGSILFDKKIKKEIPKCKYCNYPINNKRKVKNIINTNELVCFICNKKINESNVYNIENSFENQMVNFKNKKKISPISNTYLNLQSENIKKKDIEFNQETYLETFKLEMNKVNNNDNNIINLDYINNNINSNKHKLNLKDTNLDIELKLNDSFTMDDFMIDDE